MRRGARPSERARCGAVAACSAVKCQSLRDLQVVAGLLERSEHQFLDPEVELRANPNSIFHRGCLFEVAFVWELTNETIQLPLSFFQGG